MNYAGWQRRLCEPGRNELRRAEVGGREGVGGKEKTSAPPFPVATRRIEVETGVSMPKPSEPRTRYPVLVPRTRRGGKL